MSEDREQFQVEVPQRLLDDLNAAYGRTPRVSGEVERAILSSAGARLMGIRARNRWRVAVSWGAGIAAAAMLLIAIRVVILPRYESPQPVARQTQSPASQPRPTMLDAYLLARRIQLGEKLSKQWDLNSDGVVNQADARVMAQAAVKLEGGAVQ